MQIQFTYAAQKHKQHKIPTVVVRAKRKQSIADIKSLARVNTITKKAIKRSGAQTVAEILRAQADIQVRDLTGDGNQVSVSMRGFGDNAPSNTLILLNGMPLVNPDLNPPNINNIPINIIDKIEILNGSAGVALGNQAVGGVINIITKTPTKPFAELETGVGSYRRNIVRGLAMRRFTNGVGYVLSLNRDQTRNYRQHNNALRQNVFGVVDYHYRRGFTQFNYQFNRHNQLFAGALNAAQLRANRRMTSNATDFNRDGENFWQLQNLTDITPLWQVQNQLLIRQLQGHGVLTTAFRQRRTTIFYAPALSGNFLQTHLKLGANFNFDRYRFLSGVTTFSNQDRQKQSSLYGIELVPLPYHFLFNAGTRVAWFRNNLSTVSKHVNNRNQVWIYSLGIKNYLTRQMTIYFRRAGNYRFPKADEEGFTANNVFGLQPQTGVSYELGLLYHLHRMQTSIIAYRLDLDNEIAFDPRQTAAAPFGANRNLPPTRRYGLSFDNKLSLTQQLAFITQYSYIDAKFRSGPNRGKRIPFVARNNITLKLLYHFLPNWHLYVETLLLGKRQPSGDDANIARPIPWLALLNLNLRFQRKCFFATFRINNLLNRRYNSFVTFVPDIKQNFFYPAPRLNVVMVLGVHSY
ncbi:MAG: TonB-dependent receptor [Pseudomonadota bacterium]